MEWNDWNESSPIPEVTVILYDAPSDRFAIGYMEMTEEEERMQVKDARELPEDFYTTHWGYPDRPVIKREGEDG